MAQIVLPFDTKNFSIGTDFSSAELHTYNLGYGATGDAVFVAVDLGDDNLTIQDWFNFTDPDNMLLSAKDVDWTSWGWEEYTMVASNLTTHLNTSGWTQIGLMEYHYQGFDFDSTKLLHILLLYFHPRDLRKLLCEYLQEMHAHSQE